MKKIIVLCSLLLSFQTHARETTVSACKNLVNHFCDNNIIENKLSIMNTENTFCDIIDDGNRQSDGKYYPKKVIIYNSHEFNTVLLEKSCNLKTIKAKNGNSITRVVDLSGRFYLLLSSRQVVVINRVNDVMYLVNTSSEPYHNITDIKVNTFNNSIELTHDGSQKNILNEQQIEKRMNTDLAKANGCVLCD